MDNLRLGYDQKRISPSLCALSLSGMVRLGYNQKRVLPSLSATSSVGVVGSQHDHLEGPLPGVIARLWSSKNGLLDSCYGYNGAMALLQAEYPALHTMVAIARRSLRHLLQMQSLYWSLRTLDLENGGSAI